MPVSIEVRHMSWNPGARRFGVAVPASAPRRCVVPFKSRALMRSFSLRADAGAIAIARAAAS